MSNQIIYPESYLKRARKFLNKHADLEKAYQKTVSLLEKNPHHPSLRLHALQGRLAGLSSISINLQYRITLQFIIQNETIILIDVGSHDEVYR